MIIMEVRHRRPRKDSQAASLDSAQNLFARLDAFPKIDADFQTTSRSGGGLALVTFLFIIIMVILEIQYFMGTHIDYEYAVNLEVHPKIELNIDITVASPCGMIDADVYDHISQTSFAGDAFPSTSVHFEMDEDQARMHSFLTRRRARQANSTTSIEEIIFKRIDSE